ncbi:hypothetical protein ACFTWH_09200 [Streptomyces sp. NPDC057011]|uniref:hypothetical protein n=1 Tax=unclassified Streptomyces TaxID=2593676 RepID=UPI003641D028
MSVLPPDLPRLRTPVTYLSAELDRAEKALAVAQEREALAASRRPPKEPPAWLIERGIGNGRLPSACTPERLLGHRQPLRPGHPGPDPAAADR